MNLARRFSVVALLALGLSADAKSDARILEAIGSVESGMDRLAINGSARGAYQVRPCAWTDACAQLEAEGRPAYSLRRWRDPFVQDMIASAYLRVIRRHLRAAGISDPSPAVLALCWNLGPSGAAARGYRPNDYAVRVSNVFAACKAPAPRR